MKKLISFFLYTFGFIILISNLNCEDNPNRKLEEDLQSDVWSMNISNHNDSLVVFEKADSLLIVVAIKPISYPWNYEGKLIDLWRKKNDPPQTGKYPSPYSPPTHISIIIDNPDTIQVYFCNTDESSCLKITEEYLESGDYSIGFQKLDVKPGKYVINIINKDSTNSQKYYIKIPSLEMSLL